MVLSDNNLFYYFCTPQLTVPWCNGSTADFGSACPGSNPGGTAKKEGPGWVLFLLFSVKEGLFPGPDNMKRRVHDRPQDLPQFLHIIISVFIIPVDIQLLFKPRFSKKGF